MLAEIIDQPPVPPAAAHEVTSLSSRERTLSLMLGTVLFATGLWRSTWLGAGIASAGVALLSRGMSGSCPFYEWLGVRKDKLANEDISPDITHQIEYETSVHIVHPLTNVYRSCADLNFLLQSIPQIESIASLGKGRAQWLVQGPSGTHLSWDAELLCQKEDELLAWRTLPGSDIDMTGAVSFEAGPDGHGTVVAVKVAVRLPAYQCSAVMADFLGCGVECAIEQALNHLKNYFETNFTASHTSRFSPLQAK